MFSEQSREFRLALSWIQQKVEVCSSFLTKWQRKSEPELTPQEFITRYSSSLPVTSFCGIEHGEHLEAFKSACYRHGVALVNTGGNRYDLRKGGKTIGRLNSTNTHLNSRQALRICKCKIETVRHLRRSKVPAPSQQVFEQSQFKQALRYARFKKFNVVVKPSFGKGGYGVTTVIRNEDEFSRAWQYALEGPYLAYTDGPSSGNGTRVVIETKILGIDIRAIVIDGEFVCAATRLPANVVGDGRSTIHELIERKNVVRDQNPYHRKYPIVIDSHLVACLSRAGLTLESVPAESAPIILSDVANIHRGGDSCEISDLVSSDIKRMAERAANAVPGLRVSGVDFVASALQEPANLTVIEVNAYPGFGVHYTPFRGSLRNPADIIVRLMIKGTLPSAAGDTIE